MKEKFQRLLLPVDASSLALFRILFGALLFVSILRFFIHGWIEQLYIQPQLFFSFFGFSWVHPWPGSGMYIHFAVLGLLALGVTLGFYYRFCIVLFFFGFTYVELLDVSNYLNHYYLASLVCFLMIFLPAHRVWSLDSKAAPLGVPLLALWILRTQLCLVYFYAGVGKLQPDWLFQAQPLRIWLAARSDFPWIGPWLQEPAVAYAMSWTGAFYDLTIPLWLLWSRSRPFAFVVLVAFHLATAILFPTIGMFPWFMIALSTLFFPPDWPGKILRRYARRSATQRSLPTTESLPIKLAPTVPIFLFLFFTWQLVWPARHFAYPGNNLWTEEAFRFSWNVMLMEKSGETSFAIQRPGSDQREPVNIHALLTPLQIRMMSTQPDLILQMAQRIAEREKIRSGENVAVYAEAMVSLNGRPPQSLIDSSINLAGLSDSFFSKPWVLPLP